MLQVSIVLPTYNRATLLKDAIYSVLAQTYSKFELLIIDDGSDDNTKEIVETFCDARIYYYQLPHTGRISAVRNSGIRYAKGELIAFLDSDDLWKENKLQEQVVLFEQYPDIGFSVTDVITASHAKVLIPQTFHSSERIVITLLFPLLVNNRFIMYGSVLMARKTCFEKIGIYDERLKDADLLLNMQLAFHFQAAIIYEPLTIRRIHNSNVSELIPLEYYKEYLFTFSWLYQHKMISLKRLKQAKSLAHIKMGQIFKKRGQLKRSIYHYLYALRNNLFYPKHVLLLLKTIFITKPLPANSE